MSIQYCEECDKSIDTDIDLEHFNDDNSCWVTNPQVEEEHTLDEWKRIRTITNHLSEEDDIVSVFDLY